MIETYLKLFLALFAGFVIMAISLFIARKLSTILDNRRHSADRPNDDEQELTAEQDQTEEQNQTKEHDQTKDT